MKWHRRWVVSLLIIAGSSTTISAQGVSKKYGDLLKRLPEKANVLMLVDVDGILNSPLGRREKWRENAANRPTGVLGVSTDASKLVVAAGVDLQTAQERWKLGMIQTHSNPPTLSVLAAREGGYVEQLQTQNVAWTPRNFFLLSFPERIVGFVVPADRQAMSEWLFSSLVKPRDFPPSWADRAIFRADAGSQVVLAVNLAHSVSPKGADTWLRTLDSPDVKRNEVNFPLLGPSLAGVTRAFLEIDVKETIRGTIQIEFDNSLSLLKPIARELVLTALQEYGAHVEDLRKWTFDIKDKTITMTGALNEDAARRILSFMSAPRLSPSYDSEGTPPPTPGQTAKGAPPAQSPQDVGLKSTLQYYKAVTEIVATLKRQNPQSTRSTKLWYDRSAKEIEELPLLNVDLDLLKWGAQVAINLREMASGINYAAKDKVYRVAGLPNGFYGGYGYGVGGSSKAYNAEVLDKQYNAILNVQVDQRWQALETSIADMRRQMVAKYKVEF
jgi:hypothetical protein